jgi:hypothetical protein
LPFAAVVLPQLTNRSLSRWALTGKWPRQNTLGQGNGT